MEGKFDTCQLCQLYLPQQWFNLSYTCRIHVILRYVVGSCLLEFYTTLWFPKKYSSKKLSGIWIFHMHCIILRALFHVTHSFLNSTSWMAIIASLFFCESSSYRSYRACTTRRPNFLFQREKFIQKLESNPNQRHSKLKAILINIIEHIFGL